MTVLKLVRDGGTRYLGKATPSGGYERRPDTFHLRFDPESEPVTHAVVKAASFVHNVDQSELDPLGSVVDPDALQSLIGHGSGWTPQGLEVTFTYEGLEITVTDDGNIWLRWD